MEGYYSAYVLNYIQSIGKLLAVVKEVCPDILTCHAYFLIDLESIFQFFILKTIDVMNFSFNKKTLLCVIFIIIMNGTFTTCPMVINISRLRVSTS